MARHQFRIQIGDWSNDGHGKCEEYYASARKPIKEIREAYFKAKAQLPSELCPENFCCRHGDYQLPKAVSVAAKAAGYKFPEDPEGFLESATMADYVVWFLNQGDQELGAKLERKSTPPTLAFYGNDKKRRHIGFIGYGLFE